MSYILEALRKADAEREREVDGVPDLHAQRDAGSLRERLAAEARRRRLWRGLGAVGVLALAAAAWWASTPSAPTPTVPTIAMAPRVPPAVPAASAEPAAPVIMALPSPASVAPPAPAAAPAGPPATAVPPAAAPRASARPPVTVPSKAAGTAPVAAASATTRVLSLAELPDDIRRQLPALNVGGSMYSSHAASRLVILGGQVFREGDQPAEGLVIERIQLKSTVLTFRGYRFELKH